MLPPTIDQLPTIRGQRVALRWLRREDIGALFEIFSHPEVMRFWSSAPLADEAGVSLTSDCIQGGVELSADPDRLEQVLTNLLGGPFFLFLLLRTRRLH